MRPLVPPVPELRNRTPLRLAPGPVVGHRDGSLSLDLHPALLEVPDDAVVDRPCQSHCAVGILPGGLWPVPRVAGLHRPRR